jgi:hypothetical protein
MKFKVLVFVITVLVIPFTPQVGASFPKVMSSDDLKVETLPPDRGTVVFVAQREENPISGVEIKIDGESKGFTDEEGKLKVEWLLYGDHTWRAVYEGREVSQGKFEIEKIVDIQLVDMHIEKNGKRVNEVYPLGSTDMLSGVYVVKNNGTTTIDHFTWRLTTTADVNEVEMKLLQPKMPSSVFNALKDWLAKNLLTTPMGREMAFKDGEITWTNIFSHRLKNFKIEEPFKGQGETIVAPPEFKGIAPGEILKFREERPYQEWTLENIDNKASEMRTSISVEVIDEDSSVMLIKLKEYKKGPFKFKNVELAMQLKGPVKGPHQLWIDDKLCSSLNFEYDYIYDGSTIDEVLEEKNM